MRPPLVLCLGNEILCDDGFGPEVAHRLSSRPDLAAVADIISAEVAGFALLDLLADRPSVLVVDTIVTGTSHPGKLYCFEIGKWVPSYTLINSHQISLPTAVELGRKLGLLMPDAISVIAVEAFDVCTLSESLSPSVAEAIEPAVALVQKWIETQGNRRTSVPPVHIRCERCEGRGFASPGVPCSHCLGSGMVIPTPPVEAMQGCAHSLS